MIFGKVEGQWMKKDVFLQDQKSQAKIMVTLWNNKVNLIQEGDVDNLFVVDLHHR